MTCPITQQAGFSAIHRFRIALLAFAVIMAGHSHSVEESSACIHSSNENLSETDDDCDEIGHAEHDDHETKFKLDELSDAVNRAEILPLWSVQPFVEAAYGSQIVEIEIERDDGVWIYEFKVIDPSGRLLEIYVDARDGTILKVEND